MNLAHSAMLACAVTLIYRLFLFLFLMYFFHLMRKILSRSSNSALKRSNYICRFIYAEQASFIVVLMTSYSFVTTSKSNSTSSSVHVNCFTSKNNLAEDTFSDPIRQ